MKTSTRLSRIKLPTAIAFKQNIVNEEQRSCRHFYPGCLNALSMRTLMLCHGKTTSSMCTASSDRIEAFSPTVVMPT